MSLRPGSTASPLRVGHLLLAAVLVSATPSFACEVLDQECDFFSGSRTCYSIGCFTIGHCLVQSFVPGQAVLCGIEVGLDLSPNPREVVVNIQTDPEPNVGVVATSSRILSDTIGDVSWEWFDIDPALELVVGNTYYIFVDTAGTGGWPFWCRDAQILCEYPHGQAIIDGVPQSFDLLFRTYSFGTTPTIPETWGRLKSLYHTK